MRNFLGDHGLQDNYFPCLSPSATSVSYPLAFPFPYFDAVASYRYEDHGLVFCQADGKPIDPRNFLRSFDRLIAQAGLPPIRFHDARHTFATLMLELGGSPKTVQTMLGHSRVAITLDIRSHVSLELEKKAAAKLNAALVGGK